MSDRDHFEATQPEVHVGDVVPRSDAESIDPVQERRALARLQSKLFGESDAPLRIGRYELGRRLGSGGMGIVYEAEDPSLHRRIAIKLVRGGSAQALQNAIVEARALAAISEPNVVTVFDAGLVELDRGETTAFIAMQLLEGPTLAAWLDGTHGWREVLRKFAAAGRGLAAAHRRGVVHGDFKPANVLFGRGGRPFVCDFGLARVHADAEGHADDGPSVVRGTPGYIAPELIGGERPSAKSDQYAFCVALHRALHSAASGTPLGAAPLIASALPPLPSKIPSAIEAALRRGFDPDPDRRFASMNELLAALRTATRTRWYRRPTTWVLAVAVVAWLAVPRVADPCPDAASDQAHLQERVLALPELEPASAAPLASERLQQRVDALDRLAVEACRADGDDEATTRTLRCLARRRKELDHLVRRIEQSRSAHALLVAVTSMEEAGECTWSDAAAVPDEAAAEADAIDDLIAASSVAEYVGDYADAQALAEDALERASALDSKPVLARAHLRLADALYRSSVRESAVEHAAAAYETALDAQIPDLAVVAASRAMLAAYDLPGEQWLRWRRHAEAALQQTDAIHPRAVFASRMSIALEREGKYLEALEEAERAIELTQQLAADPATADPRRADIAHQQRGLVLWRLGRLEEAEAVMREVLASRSERYAATSPNLAPLRHQLAIVLREKGQVEAALELVEANYDAERRALPAGHPDIVISLGLLAALERELERYDDAEVHLQAAAEMLRADSPAMLRASVWIGWSNVFVDTDRLAEAEAKLMGARTVLDAEGDAAWHARATVLLNLTELHRLQADQVRALQDLGGALELLCPHLPRARCEQAEAVVRTAREAVAAGDAEAAERIHEAVASLRELGPRP